MRAWSWFAITPVALLAAYWAAPPLEAGMSGNIPAATAVAPLNLPNIAEKPAPKAVNPADKDIRFAAFGIVVPSPIKIIPKTKLASEIFSLQSILMTGKSGSAVIDGVLVHPGDIVGSYYRVAKIEPQAVWLAAPHAKEAKPAKGAKRGKSVKEVLEVLRFPEYQDRVLPVALASAPTPHTPAVSSQPSAAPAPNTGAGGMERDYKQILEKLKL
jgi:hypothetical protein